ncbi:phosphorylase b kinase regulatory subunit beta-like isoform X7 [Mercenaria mercenaria]|uniref:phosphorylase b kinase regulatory subunit beta-like isoform X7 n=1 Tax=Mercenaria mercenaria TaxID=6596 RepID=UPI00234F883A|nr:phosphorylase b kinase regulatory subunit beta-like isoform X7 [Mercenaria mercenaria]
MFYARQLSRQLSRDTERRKSTDSFSRGSVIDGLPLGKVGDNRVSTGDAEGGAEKDLKKELDNQYTTLKRHILQFQSVTLGLFPRIGYANEQPVEAHVRDSIYCATAAWALSQAYRRIDNDQGRTHELAQVAVKTMRGILYCWIRQADKVEKFKENQSASHALHSVFDPHTGDPLYKDDEFEHLQIDVVGLYLIMLVQMITSGLQIIYTTDEVNFVQNLVFYVERAYRTPDYGMWERGSKYNNGSTEVHASSIGIAKAALEAINGVNLFGDQGASWSVIFVDIDAHNRNRTIFESILPRESNSKNTDASLLATVGWPAFGIHEEPIRSRTIDKVKRKLRGPRGFKRFIRDGYKTVVEDNKRKYYKPAEIKNFDGIECEWPMFYVYMLIDCIFLGDKEGIATYSKLLDNVMTRSNEDGIPGLLLPQYFFIPADQIDRERSRPGSADRIPSDVGSTKGIFLWGQSVYFISQLLVKDLLNVNDLDPIRRHLPASERPKVNSRYSSFQITPPDLVLQVVLIAESSRLQQLLATYGIQTQTPHQVEPIQIWSPKELSRAYEYLGINKKLGLTGRPKRPFGVLSTSKIYRVCGATVLCYPLLFEVVDFYMAQDISIVIDDLKNDLAFLSKCWKLAGRPTFCMLIRENNIRGKNFSEFLELLAQFKSGDVDGIRVRVGRLQTLISSACIEHLDFLTTLPDQSIFQPFQESNHGRFSFKSLTDIPTVLELADDTVLNEQELKVKATWDLIQMFKGAESLTAQNQILKLLLYREGPNYHFEGVPLSRRLEQLVAKAGLHKRWEVVRCCSSLLGKLVDSLAPSITSILVRGKHLTVGVFGHEEEVLDKPVSPNEIKNILYSKCMAHDTCQAVLQQELILAIGKHIATSPDAYDGILKIRIGWFVRAMEMELEQEDEHVKIESLSPYQVKQLLLSILVHRSDEYDLRTPLQRRQLDGALSRVPKDFYERVWEILERTPGGIKVAGYLLPQQPTLSDMTMQELNFSLLVEQMLSKIVDPAYRQLMVEAFMVVSTILRRNPELVFHQSVNMDRAIQDAFEEFQKDRSRLDGHEKQDDMRCFFNTMPNVKHGTTSYIIKAVVKNLLDGDIKVSMEDMCCIS